jgi:SAM-dependent methyltransferase
LARDNRYLAGLLRPGLSVLDVGCGTGAITAGIAQAVGADGLVLGVDRDERLLEIARRQNPELRFEQADAVSLPFHQQFDVVTAARTLQWISEPVKAVRSMRQAAKAGGSVVVLDYNHALNQWEPDPPPAFGGFYRAFLEWRQANDWDNEMGNHLPGLFASAGLVDVESHSQDEVVQRGDERFAEQSALWSEVMENLGGQILQAGFLAESQLREAAAGYKAWVQTALVKQTLRMRAVAGKAP